MTSPVPFIKTMQNILKSAIPNQPAEESGDLLTPREAPPQQPIESVQEAVEVPIEPQAQQIIDGEPALDVEGDLPPTADGEPTAIDPQLGPVADNMIPQSAEHTVPEIPRIVAEADDQLEEAFLEHQKQAR